MTPSPSSGWGAMKGGKGGLSIQELAGEEVASLNSFLSEEGGDPYMEPIQSSVVLEEEEEVTSGSSTPDQGIAPTVVKADVHSISIHRTPLHDSSTDTKASPQMVTHCQQKGKTILIESHSSTQVKEGTKDPVIAPNKPSHIDEQSTHQENSVSKSLKLDLKPVESSSIPIHIDRMPPTPSPTPPSQLTTPISTPITEPSSSLPTVINSSPTKPSSSAKSLGSSPSRQATSGSKTIPITRKTVSSLD